jgi:1-acyl-sn-glycerol-3-phosphate acyltransferase
MIIAGHIGLGAVLTLFLALRRRLGKPSQSAPGIVHWWYRRLLPMLGIEISAVHGSPCAHSLLAANHVSWLDVPVLGALTQITFLSKDEVRHWPLIGWMSAQLGTLFIRRGGHETGPLAKQIASEIQNGRPVVIFPEGTTSDGRSLRHFHPRLFAAAQDPNSWVQPVAVRYGTNANPDANAPFIGDDTLLAHLWRVAQQPSLQVQVHFLTPIAGSGSDRRALADRCRFAIATALAIDPGLDSPARPKAGAAP